MTKTPVKSKKSAQPTTKRTRASTAPNIEFTPKKEPKKSKLAETPSKPTKSITFSTPKNIPKKSSLKNHQTQPVDKTPARTRYARTLTYGESSSESESSESSDEENDESVASNVDGYYRAMYKSVKTSDHTLAKLEKVDAYQVSNLEWMNSKKYRTRFSELVEEFPKWMIFLATGQNVLLYGYG